MSTATLYQFQPSGIHLGIARLADAGLAFEEERRKTSVHAVRERA